MLWRAICDHDLVTCLDIDRAHIGAELVGEIGAIAAWKILIRSCSFQSAVIETDPPIAGHRTVSFGASVFVSRAFADEEVANPRPGLNARIIASIDCGQSVVLNQSQLRSANTKGGLDLVVLYGNWRRDILSANLVSEAQTLLALSFLHLHQGFRLNRILVESKDQQEINYTAAAGLWHIVSDFRQFHAEHPATHWNRDRVLASVTVENAFRVPGSIVAMLFQYREPVLALQEADQQLVRAALTGATDDELARNLQISLSSVKKRWRSLFERASTHAELFPNMCDGLEDAGRGRQKRQFILTYAREHPEELRPFESTGRQQPRLWSCR